MLFMHNEPVSGYRKCHNACEAREKKRNGGKIDSGRAQLGKKMDQLEEYTSINQQTVISHKVYKSNFWDHLLL